MSDDLKNRGPQDRARINVNEAHELRYWTKELGVTEAQLREAVKAVACRPLPSGNTWASDKFRAGCG